MSQFVSAIRARHHKHANRTFETLQRRELLAADLFALWNADDLKAELNSGSVVESWNDQLQSIPALRFGNPKVFHNALNGHSVVRFDPHDGKDRLDISSQNDPLANEIDFSIVIAFATNSTQLVGDVGQWYFNSGIVDANGFGLTEDWGVSINESGQVAAGFGKPAKTVYANGPSNDGIAHVVVVTKQGDGVSLNVDGEAMHQTGFSAAARAARPVRIGAGGQPFDGDIAEIRFYHGALDEIETQQIVQDLQNEYVNLPPNASNDDYRIDEDTTLIVEAANGVLSNDSDPESNAMVATILDNPQNGSVDLAFDGSFQYTPAVDFFGSDRFTYQVSDNDGSDVGVVNIVVDSTYDPMQLSNDSYLAVAGATLTVNADNGLAANDLNPDANPFTIRVEPGNLDGELSLTNDGAFQFEAKSGFNGTTAFDYTTIDAAGNSVTATATILVQPEAIVINEFSASNLTVVDDEDGDSSDWIELWNHGQSPIDLAGWYLTDDTDRLKWQFPQVRLEAGERVVVFASGKDRRDADSPLQRTLSSHRAENISHWWIAIRGSFMSFRHAFHDRFAMLVMASCRRMIQLPVNWSNIRCRILLNRLRVKEISHRSSRLGPLCQMLVIRLPFPALRMTFS